MKKNKKWQLQRKEPVIDLGILNIEHHYYKNPRNEKVVKTISINVQDAVNVIALTKDRKVILVKQFRFGIGAYTLEVPGGMIDEGEERLVAVKRELREETGFAGADWTYLGKIQSNPVFMDAYVYHYLALNVSKQFELELDDAEDVELIEVPLDEIDSYIEKGIIQHPHTITAFHFLKRLDVVDV